MNSILDGSKVMEAKDILAILPHRYPFLLVDKVIDYDLEKGSICGLKAVTSGEPWSQGHFPGIPIMPGVLIIEALAQNGGILIHLKGEKDRIALLMNVNNAKFRLPVRPGDTLLLKGEGLHLGSRAGKIKASAWVNDKIAVEAEIGFALVEKNRF
jgi:3-hydroxyacyl-[acyl-carrier-protein] dehydratase